MIIKSLEASETKYQIILSDPPWEYKKLSSHTNQATRHYETMSTDSICVLPIKNITDKNAVLFLWTTSPKLEEAFKVLNAWGFHYRGIAFVWIKTRKDGKIKGPQGVRPTFTKSITEYVLVGTTCEIGKPFKTFGDSIHQEILAPTTKHSEKPKELYSRIEQLCGLKKRIELFARDEQPNWDCWGNQLTNNRHNDTDSTHR